VRTTPEMPVVLARKILSGKGRESNEGKKRESGN